MNGDQWLDEQEAMEIGVKTGFKQGFQAGYTTGYEKGKSSQKAVLDKIIAKIKQEYTRLSVTRADETLELGECLGLKMSLKIIDKYKAESEVQE